MTTILVVDDEHSIVELSLVDLIIAMPCEWAIHKQNLNCLPHLHIATLA
jgi:hypothetical protein